MRANNSIIWNILAWWFYLFIYSFIHSFIDLFIYLSIYLFIYSFIYYLFIYSLSKYKSPNFFVCTNKLLHVCNRCIVFKCVSRTLTTFNTEHFARLVKMKMIHDGNFHHDWFVFFFSFFSLRIFSLWWFLKLFGMLISVFNLDNKLLLLFHLFIFKAFFLVKWKHLF